MSLLYLNFCKLSYLSFNVTYNDDDVGTNSVYYLLKIHSFVLSITIVLLLSLAIRAYLWVSNNAVIYIYDADIHLNSALRKFSAKPAPALPSVVPYGFALFIFGYMYFPLDDFFLLTAFTGVSKFMNINFICRNGICNRSTASCLLFADLILLVCSDICFKQILGLSLRIFNLTYIIMPLSLIITFLLLRYSD